MVAGGRSVTVVDPHVPTAPKHSGGERRAVLCCVDGSGRASVIDLAAWRVSSRKMIHHQSVVEHALTLHGGERIVTSGREAVVKVWRVTHDGTLVEIARTLRKDVVRCMADLGDGRAALTTYTNKVLVSTEFPWLLDT